MEILKPFPENSDNLIPLREFTEKVTPCVPFLILADTFRIGIAFRYPALTFEKTLQYGLIPTECIIENIQTKEWTPFSIMPDNSDNGFSRLSQGDMDFALKFAIRANCEVYRRQLYPDAIFNNDSTNGVTIAFVSKDVEAKHLINKRIAQQMSVLEQVLISQSHKTI